MVEELLKFLIGEVDAQLLEAVELHTQISSRGNIRGEGDALVQVADNSSW
jgi:ethanolamine utilization microcompartment shell protein EutL